MLRNYFKTALRNLMRNKVYASLNILGLTIGITCFSLILIYVENELSFDQFHTEESYRFMVNEQTGDGETRRFGIVPVKSHNQIADNIAGIEDMILVRDWGAGPQLIEYKDVKIKSRALFGAEPDFFRYFNFKLIQGDTATVLSAPNNVVITESTAKKIFGEANPMGEVLKVSGNMSYSWIVTGVIEDPKNSHIDFEFLFNFDLRDEANDYIILREGFANSVYGFYKFEKGVEAADVVNRVEEYFDDLYKDNADVLAALDKETYEFQPIDKIYFDSGDVVFNGFKSGDKQNLYLLASIGIFILLIACMNYINATTAKAISRSKEIGVRKVFGAFRRQLILQFMGEAFMVSFAAVLLSVLLTDLGKPFFENLMQTELRFALHQNPVYLISLVIILFTVNILSGTYPSLILSGFKPNEALKSLKGKGMLKGNSIRTLLVGVQLFLTMVLVSSVLLIVKQSQFINDKDLGFSKEDILIIPNNSPKVAEQIETFKSELMRSPYIHGVTAGMDVLGFEYTNNSGAVILEGFSPNEAPVASFFTVGMDFIDIQNIEVISGRGFNPSFTTDSTAIIVNEAFVKAYGDVDPIGKTVRLWSTENEPRRVIGVVKDFNFRSLRSEVSPAIFQVSSWSNWFFTLKIDPNNKKSAVDHARTVHESIEPNYPMGSWFLEDTLKSYYGEEQRLQTAIQTFAIICIFIACLGLYGMTAFTIERKTKEIGIRKVLGAKVRQLVWLVNKKFVWIVVISGIGAVPLVYYLIEQWLNGFAYRIAIGLDSFLFASLIVLLIAVITVSSQAIKAGISNPSKTLRTE